MWNQHRNRASQKARKAAKASESHPKKSTVPERVTHIDQHLLRASQPHRKAYRESEPDGMKSNTPPVTLEELVGEYERELDVRKRGYPKFVQAGKLTQEEADRRIEILEYGLARERSNLTAIQVRDKLDAEERQKRNKEGQDFARPRASYGSRKKGVGRSI